MFGSMQEFVKLLVDVSLFSEFSLLCSMVGAGLSGHEGTTQEVNEFGSGAFL